MVATERTRVAFAGTPEFAVPSLQRLLAAGFDVVAVLTQPDRSAGRGQKLTASPIKQVAREHALPVLQPDAIDEELRQRLGGVRVDLLVVVAYGLILPRWLLDWPQIAPVNVHASLLPRWRGAAPIQRAILAGDDATGISIMRMSPGLDRGPVYSQRSTPIEAGLTAGELHDRLAELGAGLLAETLPGIVAGTLVPSAQEEALATYAPKLEKREALLDWRLPAIELERQVRAFNPWPVAEARSAAGLRLRIWQARAVATGTSADPGTVVVARGVVDVATGDGCLRLERLQRSGGRVVAAEALLAGLDLEGIVFVGPD